MSTTSVAGHGLSRPSRIDILSTLDPTDRFATFVHEFAHDLLHRRGERAASKTVRETGAEAVALIVSTSVGVTLSMASHDYIGLYDWWPTRCARRSRGFRARRARSSLRREPLTVSFCDSEACRDGMSARRAAQGAITGRLGRQGQMNPGALLRTHAAPAAERRVMWVPSDKPGTINRLPGATLALRSRAGDRRPTWVPSVRSNIASIE
jgi:hypothetical protein